MKKYNLVIICSIILFACNHMDKDKEEVKLNQFMDEWHHSAAIADEDIFFGSLDSNAVYLGTDPNERWLKHEFMDWGLKYFERDTAWAFTPYNRVWEFSEDMSYAWFDELLKTHMGICRGSGVVKRYNDEWKIKHYNLALTISNDKMNDYKKIIDIENK